MHEIIIKVKQKGKLPFVKELLGNLSFVQIVEKKSVRNRSKKILEDIDEAVGFIKAYRKGNTPVNSMKQLLDEI